jgi:hypothetical protein
MRTGGRQSISADGARHAQSAAYVKTRVDLISPLTRFCRSAPSKTPVASEVHLVGVQERLLTLDAASAGLRAVLSPKALQQGT